MTHKLLNIRIAVSIVLIITGVLLMLTRHPLHESFIRHSLTFEPGSESYKAWQTNDPPLTLDLYFFNWTNSDQIANRSVTPHFEEIGPYRFYEIKEKYDIQIHDNGTVSFKYVQKYFLHEDSPRNISDMITTVNPVALTAAFKSRYASFWMKASNNFLLMMEKSKITATHSVEEWLFQGYVDKVMTTVRMIPILGADVQDKFGWFYNKNHTLEKSGIFSMNTDTASESFGRIVQWNYKNTTNNFEGSCNHIRGSAGEFHPMKPNKDVLEIYSTELCSFARLDYEAEVNVKGIQAYKYSADTLFDNGTRVPEYKCFCNGGCTPSGVHNVSLCRMNSPIFLSLPHFYNADPYYTSLVDGLKPTKEKHDFYIAVEPISAIVVDIRARMQLNMLLQPIEGFTLFRDVPRAYIPIFYFDQAVTSNDDLATKIVLIQYIPTMILCFALLLTIIGFMISLPVLYLLYKAFCDPNPNHEAVQTTMSVNDVYLQSEIVPLKEMPILAIKNK